MKKRSKTGRPIVLFFSFAVFFAGAAAGVCSQPLFPAAEIFYQLGYGAACYLYLGLIFCYCSAACPALCAALLCLSGYFFGGLIRETAAAEQSVISALCTVAPLVLLSLPAFVFAAAGAVKNWLELVREICKKTDWFLCIKNFLTLALISGLIFCLGLYWFFTM